MFTGLVEETGRIINIFRKDSGLSVLIKGNRVMKDIKIGDSIAVNGVCLTVTETGNEIFAADVMHETISRSTLKRIKTGDEVNLEKSLTLATFLGGHLVMGDVDCEAVILSAKTVGIAKLYEFQLDKNYRNNMKYVVEKGRITIDGASLTVVSTDDEKGAFSVSLIPHTLENITLGKKKPGDFVNIETDLFGKYVEKIMKFENITEIYENKKISQTDGKKERNGKNTERELTLEFLKKNGF